MIIWKDLAFQNPNDKTTWKNFKKTTDKVKEDKMLEQIKGEDWGEAKNLFKRSYGKAPDSKEDHEVVKKIYKKIKDLNLSEMYLKEISQNIARIKEKLPDNRLKSQAEKDLHRIKDAEEGRRKELKMAYEQGKQDLIFKIRNRIENIKSGDVKIDGLNYNHLEALKIIENYLDEFSREKNKVSGIHI